MIAKLARNCVVAAGLAAVLGCLSPAAAADKIPVAIMEFTTKGGVTQQQMDALGDLLADTVRNLGRYRVIGSSDIKSVLLAQEKRSMVTGCNDMNCMAEIGGALGVRWMVVGNVSKFGSAYLLNIKLLDAQKVKVIGSESVKVTGGEEELLDAVPKTTRRVFTKGARVMFPRDGAATTAGAGGGGDPGLEISRQVSRPMSPGRLWGHITFWSGLGLAAFGGVGLWQGKSAADKYADGDMGAWDTSRTWTGMGFTCLGLGAAAMVTGVVLWLLDPGAEEHGTTAVLAPLPDGTGTAFTLTGRF